MKNVLSILSIMITVSALFGSPTKASERHNDCPASFHNVSVHSNATVCQTFDANEHSEYQSMSYFVAVPPQQLIEYYQSQHPQLTVHSSVNQRVLLTMEGNKTRIAISQDKHGAQIDILVL